MALIDQNSNKPFNMTGILFGNVDNNGQLEESYLDDDAKTHLSSLNDFGFDSIFQGELSHEEIVGGSPIYYDDNDIMIKEEVIGNDSSYHSDYDAGSPVQNFTDVSEKSSDSQTEDLKSTTNEGIDIDTNEKSSEYHTEVMSPLQTHEDKQSNCPYSSILPSKYKNVDITELFPEFRPNQILRFQKLFGPGKKKNLPDLWRQAKKINENSRRNHDESSHLNQEDKTVKSRGWVMNYGPDPDPDQCASDDELKLLGSSTSKVKVLDDVDDKKDVKTGPSVKDWRFGPAKLWFDMINAPETEEDFDYGFKLAKQEESNDNVKVETVISDDINEDAFLMVSQLHWEDDVVWDANKIAHKVTNKSNRKISNAGWIPSTENRKAYNHNNVSQPSLKDDKSKKHVFSILPTENEDLVYGLWEDEVIWDAENMIKIPKPKILTLDLNDDNIILGIPDDIEEVQSNENNSTQRKPKTSLPYAKKSKTILSQQGLLEFNEETEEKESKLPEMFELDPFNISNDTHYMPVKKVTSSKYTNSCGVIKHSTPALELAAPFIPTYMSLTKLRSFHRPPLRRYSRGPLSRPAHHQVYSLLNHIRRKAAIREQENIASGGGSIFLMRTAEDLTGKDGGLILIEFTEEYPPLMNQVGMCSKINNYFKRTADKDSELPNFKYGETMYTHTTSPFLGSLVPGQSIQAIENNMYRAPIYEHKVPQTDFLIIRTRDRYYIREADSIFTAGQQCPLHTVPAPNSKMAVKFSRDYLLVYIYRLFWKSVDTPRRIKMEDIKKAFPLYSESNIRKRLKLCATFKRTGMYSNWWVIRSDFRLPTEEEIQAMVTPEQCCEYFSMKAGEQRLKDAGYKSEKIFAIHQNDDDEDFQMKIDDEVKVAPWNTTTAYIEAMQGKCILQLTGPADPTGCGEGFSYVRVSNKPVINKTDQEHYQKRPLLGTDADLRRLRLPAAKQLLLQCGMDAKSINGLNRWEIVDLVRTMSTYKAKAGEEHDSKFSRGNRYSVAEYQERYKQEAQRIFNLQNRVLSSAEVLSSDENWDSDDDSDIEELGKKIESGLANKTTTTRLLATIEEEREREELKQMMMDDTSQKSNSKEKDNDSDLSQPRKRVLEIHRTYEDSDGKKYTRSEYIRNSDVIDLYLKLKNSNDKKVINDFLSLTEEQKEEKRKEKRRIQEQLRRIKRQEQRAAKEKSIAIIKSSSTQDNKLSSQFKKDSTVTCSACGSLGHTKTNKFCPAYQSSSESSSFFDITNYEKQRKVENEDDSINNNHDLVKVDGTKLRFSAKLIKQIQAENDYDGNTSYHTNQSMMSKNSFNPKKRSRSSKEDIDYNESITYIKPTKRRPTDPIIPLSAILEKILNEIRRLPDVEPFLYPVNKKLVIDYYKVIKNPMDLQTIRDKIKQFQYETREKFLDDINLMVKNSSLYNGPFHVLTKTAQRMLEICAQKLEEKDESLMRLERAINPLMGDDDFSKLAFILENIMENKLKSMAESRLFLGFKKSLNKNNNIKTPMDLNMITRKISFRKYHNRYEFLHDIKLILENNILINSSFVKEAHLLVKTCEESFDEYNEYLTQIENNIVKNNSHWPQANENNSSRIPSPSINSNASGGGSVNSKSDENEFIDVEGVDENSMSLPENDVDIKQEFQFNKEECEFMEEEDFSDNSEMTETKVDICQDLACSDDDDDDDEHLLSETVDDVKTEQNVTVNKINFSHELAISSEEEIEPENNQEQSFDIDGVLWF